MAYLQQRNGWYHIRWRDAAGHQHSQALKTKDPKVAKELLLRYKLQHTRGRGLPGRTTFGKAWELFMLEHVATLAEATRLNYESTGRRFLKEWRTAQLDAIDRGTIQRYLNGQVGKLSRSRINLMRMMLSGFFTWAVKAGLVFYNPVKDTKRVKDTPTRLKTINQEQASLLLSVAEPYWRPHMFVMYLCGLRMGELRGLTWDDYSTTRGTLTIRKTVYKQGIDMLKETNQPFSRTKSKRGERIIPLSPLAIHVLDDWKRYGWYQDCPNPYDLIFPSSEGNPLNDNTFRQALTRAADRAREKWEGREPFPERITPHTLRHGWARMMLEAGVRLPELMALGGWSNLEQVRVYTAWEVNKDEKAAELQSRLLGGDFGGKTAYR